MGVHVQLGELRGVSGALRVASESVQRLTGSLDPEVRLFAIAKPSAMMTVKPLVSTCSVRRTHISRPTRRYCSTAAVCWRSRSRTCRTGCAHCDRLTDEYDSLCDTCGRQLVACARDCSRCKPMNLPSAAHCLIAFCTDKGLTTLPGATEATIQLGIAVLFVALNTKRGFVHCRSPCLKTAGCAPWAGSASTAPGRPSRHTRRSTQEVVRALA